MAGFGATHRLRAEGLRPVVYDKASYFGGHTASFLDAKGFTFDLGPHISFTKDPRVQALLAGFVDDQYEALQVKLDNIWKGRRLTHPVQLHLNGLPHDLIVEIIADFVKVHDAEKRPIERVRSARCARFLRNQSVPRTIRRPLSMMIAVWMRSGTL